MVYSGSLSRPLWRLYGDGMSVIANVGAGPGLGIAVATEFGHEGFTVALIVRDPDHLSVLKHQLAADRITAKGYVADVYDRPALTAALERATEDLGPGEVLQFSPVPDPAFLRPVLQTSVEDLQAATQFSIPGFATAARWCRRACSSVPQARFCSSTARAPRRRTVASPGPPPPSPENRLTWRCSMTPWHRAEPACDSSSSRGRSAEETLGSPPMPFG